MVVLLLVSLEAADSDDSYFKLDMTTTGRNRITCIPLYNCVTSKYNPYNLRKRPGDCPQIFEILTYHLQELVNV